MIYKIALIGIFLYGCSSGGPSGALPTTDVYSGVVGDDLTAQVGTLTPVRDVVSVNVSNDCTQFVALNKTQYDTNKPIRGSVPGEVYFKSVSPTACYEISVKGY